MSGSSGTLAEAEERYRRSLEDPDVAFEQAKHWTAESTPEYGELRGDRRQENLQGRGKPHKNPRIVQPLPGNQELTTDQKIRAIVALQSQKIPKLKIEEMLGMSRKYVNDLECRYPQAFDSARADQMKWAMEKYRNTMTYVVGALSDAAPVAMSTFVDLMEDKEASTTVRLNAAKEVMKMFLERGGKPGNNTADVVRAAGDVVVSLREQDRKKDDYIIDVEAEDDSD